MTKQALTPGRNDGPELAQALAPHRAAILSQLAQAWRQHAPKNTVMLGAPQRAEEAAEAIGSLWFEWLENIHDLTAVRELAMQLVRQGITYTTASTLAQTLSSIVTELTTGDAQYEVSALKLTRHFSAAFLDQVATQHELRTQQEREHLAVQLQASAEVGRAVASILDTDQLLREVVNLITDRFGFYYTAVFTLDHTSQYAVLREATGQAGEVLKNLKHKLDIHSQSMVGAAITSRRPRVAAEASKDIARFSNPLLPDTRSEIALPLTVGERVLGALDVQSTVPNAFDAGSVSVLQNMADQIAIALENARLFERAQATLRDSQIAQANLARNKAQLADALQVANLSYWEYDLASDQFHFDDQAFVLLHLTPEQLGGNTMTGNEFVRRFVHPDDRRQARQLFRTASTAADPQHTAEAEMRMLDADGGLHWIIIRLRVVRDESGKVSRLIGTNQDITARKLAEEQLRRNQEQLNEALRIAHLGYWEYDVARDVFLFNDQFYAIFNTTAEAEGGYEMPSARYAQKFVYPDDAALVGSEIGAALQSTDPDYRRQIDHRMVRADGTLGYITVRFRIERDAAGHPVRFIGANEDITARKQAETALRQSETQLSQALQLAKLAYWEYDVAKDRFLFNDQFYALFHTTAEQYGGYELSSAHYAEHFVHPDDLAIVGSEIKKALNSTDRHYARLLEHRILYADGGIGYISVNINIERDEAGHILRYYGANQDITESKLAEAALQRERGLLRGVIDSVPDLIFYKNQAGVYLGCNVAFEAFAGRSERELLGRTDYDLFPHDIADFFREQDAQMLTQRTSRRNEEWVTYPDGRRVLLDTLKTPFYDEAGQVLGLIGISRDITVRKQADSERERLLARTEALYHTSADLNAAHTYAEVLEVLRAHTIMGEADRNLSLNLYDRPWQNDDMPEWSLTLDRWTTLSTDAVRSRYRLHDFPAAHLLRADAPTVVDNIATDERLDEATRQLYTVQFRAGSTVFVPLVAAGQWIGFLNGIYSEPRSFGEEDIRLLMAAAVQAGVVIQSIRRLAEVAESEARFRDVARATADWVWEVDTRGVYTYCSDRVSDVLGYTPAEVLGKTPYDFMPAEEAKRVAAIVNQLSDAHQPLRDLETRNRTKDGREVILLANGVPVLDEAGVLSGYRGVNEDITERKLAEAEVARSERLLRTVIDSTPDWIFIKDREHRYRLVNQGYANSLHIPVEAFIGKNDLDLGFPEDLVKGNPAKGLAGFWADDRAVMDSGQTKTIPNDIVAIDGALRTYNTIKTPLRDTDGQVWAVLAFARDITERENLMAQQQKRAIQLQTAADVSRASSSILQLDELLTTVVELVRDRFDLYYVGTFLLDDSGQWAVLRAGTGEAGHQMLASNYRLPVDENSMIGWTIVHQQARIALDVGQDAVHFNNPLLPNTRSEMALPLVSRGRLLGAATIQSSQAAAFTADDVTVLQAMADQITTAAENARLFEQTQQTLRQMSALNDITTAVSREIELEPVLQAAYDSVQRVLPVDAFIVALYDAATNAVEYPLVYDEGRRYSEPPTLLVPTSRVGRVLQTGEPILENVPPEHRQTTIAVAGAIGNAAKSSASLLYVPLKRGPETVGVLSVQSYRFNAFNVEHIDLLSSVANQLTIAILNARLFEQTRRAVEELNTLNRQLTGEAWQAYTQQRSPDAVVWYANDPVLTQVSPAQAQALAAGEVTVQAADDEAEISVPISLRGQLIGALRFRAPAAKWTAEAQAIATSIAGHLAQAAENTRLIEQTQRSAQREKQISQAADKIHRASDLQSILQTAVQEIARLTGSAEVGIQLGKPESRDDGYQRNGQPAADESTALAGVLTGDEA